MYSCAQFIILTCLAQSCTPCLFGGGWSSILPIRSRINSNTYHYLTLLTTHEECVCIALSIDRGLQANELPSPRHVLELLYPKRHTASNPNSNKELNFAGELFLLRHAPRHPLSGSSLIHKCPVPPPITRCNHPRWPRRFFEIWQAIASAAFEATLE